MPKKPPATPLLLIATAFQDPPRVALNWADVSTNETRFELQRCTGATCAGFVSLQTLSRNTQSTTDSTVVSGQTYRYRIRAVGPVGASLWSNVATVTILATPPTPLPAAPTSITATAGDGQIVLNGTPAPNVDTYTLKRGLTSGSETTLVTGLTTPAYTNTGLTNGTRYFYVFVSVKDGISSLNSNEVSAVPTAVTPVPPPTVPNPPTLTATAGTEQVSLNWSLVSGATYTLKRRTAGGSYATILSGVPGTSYVNTGLTGGTTYYYVVTATVSGLTSAQSNEVSATPTAPPPQPPDTSLFRYVATNGNDGNAGSITAPWQTIAYGVSQLTAGMTLYIRAGTYYEIITLSNFTASGTAWTAGNFITVSGYPGESVTITTTNPTASYILGLGGGLRSYIRFQGGDSTHFLTIDGINVTSGDGYGISLGSNIDLTNVEVKNTWGHAIIGDGTGHEWHNLYVHDNGRIPYATYNPGVNGVYWQGSGLTITGGRFIGNKCYGVRFGSSGSLETGNVLDGATIQDNGYHCAFNGTSDCGSGGGGIVFANANMIARNCIITGNLVGIELVTLSGRTSTNLQCYNNTITGNVGAGVYLNNGNGALTDNIVKNNIIYGNGSTIVDQGTNTTADHNPTSDPLFMGTTDYRLQSTSPALNAAVTLSQVPYDIVGVPRPQGTAPDCGAYERIVVSGGGGGTGTTYTPANSAALTALLNGGTLRPGDTIQLTDGTTYTGNFHLSSSGTASQPITITRSGTLPAVPNMMSSSSRSAFLASMATAPVLRTTDTTPALLVDINANYWTIQGVKVKIDIAGQGSSSTAIKGGFLSDGNTNATSASQLPNTITFDRVWVTGTTTGDCTYGFYFNGTSVTIKNCYIEEIHGVGQESKGILVTQGIGPYTITNNYIEAACMNIFFGGEDPRIPLAIPSDLTITGNYLTKDPTWDPNAANHGHVYGGIHWSVKNVVEFKNAQRITLSGNVLEYCWRDAQAGYLLLVTPQNQDGGCAWCGVQHILIENNIIRHGNAGMQLTGEDADGDPSLQVVGLTIRNNLWYDLDGTRWGQGGPDGRMLIEGHSPADITFTHNTVDNSGSTFIVFSSSLGGGAYEMIGQVNISDNFGKATDYIIFGDGGAVGQNALNAYVTGAKTFLNNVIGSDGALTSIPPTTDTPSVAAWNASFTNRATGDYTLVPGSPYKAGGAKDASDGTSVGVNVALLPIVT